MPNLKDFIVGDNVEAFAEICALADGRGSQFVYLFGPHGTGKSFLAEALNAGRSSEAVPDYQEGRKLYVVDDVHTLNAEQKQKLFDLFTEVRAHPGTSLLTTGLKSPQALKSEGLREDISSRLSWGSVFELVPLQEKQKRQAFIDHANERGLIVSEETMNWILTYLPRDMSTLSRLFDGVERYSRSKKRPLTIPLIKEWLEQEKMRDRNE
ncbi:MAG: DnaA regulatory inactivator Hda [Burkholderiales bacterium]|nr:DnaA regulatory inactivator Hda [Burkholderiales bacterium]